MERMQKWATATAQKRDQTKLLRLPRRPPEQDQQHEEDDEGAGQEPPGRRPGAEAQAGIDAFAAGNVGLVNHEFEERVGGAGRGGKGRGGGFLFQLGREPFAELLLEPHRGDRGVHRGARGSDGRGGIGDHESVGAADFLEEGRATHHDDGRGHGERPDHKRVDLTVGGAGLVDDHARRDEFERLFFCRDVGLAVGDLVTNPRRVGERDDGDAAEVVAKLGGGRAEDRRGGATAERDSRDSGENREGGGAGRIRFHGSE